MIRIICFFISLLTSLFGTLGVDSSPAYDPNVYAAGLPSYYEVGEVRVELLSDSLVRIETKGPKGFENRPSFTVQNRENWKDVDFTVSEQNGTVVIRSAKYSGCVLEKRSTNFMRAVPWQQGMDVLAARRRSQS